MSQHSKTQPSLPEDEQNEKDDLNNLFFLLLLPVFDQLSISFMLACTYEDSPLAQLLKTIKPGKTWISKYLSIKLKKVLRLILEKLEYLAIIFCYNQKELHYRKGW